MIDTKIRYIIIDLMPVLPGSINGGAKIFVVELIRRLAQFAPQTKITLLCTTEAYEELGALEGPNVVRQFVPRQPPPPPPQTRPRRLCGHELRRLPRFCRELLHKLRKFLSAGGQSQAPLGNPDLIFFPFGLSYPCGRLPLISTPTPCVAIVYDLQHLVYPQFFRPEDLVERQYCLDFHRKNSLFVVISDFVRDSVIAQGHAKADSVFTVHIRLKSRLPDVDADTTRSLLQRLNLAKERYFVYPANFWQHKNHEMLLVGFSLARRSNLPNDFKLVLTGSPGKQMNELESAAQALELAGSVIFPGFLSDSEFAALIRASAGVVFPSLYEGFGMPVIEAMAVGRPVACSDRTSLPEIAGNAALYFDPRKPVAIAEAICRLANDEKLRSTLIANGFRRAELFSNIDDLAREYWDVFERAAKKIGRLA